VNVTQTFHNPTKEKIEAVYVFPLPHEAAVDNMTMVIGERKIVGIIKRREEARRIYERPSPGTEPPRSWSRSGPTSSRSRSGNIEPGQEVRIEISYVDVLRYDMGTYEFSFPMVVGPRYIPGAPVASPQPRPAELQGKVSPPVADTTRVPDASRISPPVLKPGVRNGHDISASPFRSTPACRSRTWRPITSRRCNATAKARRKSRSRRRLAPQQGLRAALRRGRRKARNGRAFAHGQDYPDAAKLGDGYFMLMIQPQEDERLTKEPAAGDRVSGPTFPARCRAADRQGRRGDAGDAQALPRERHRASDQLRQPGRKAVRQAGSR
jgi:hypothetical protein